LGGDAKCPIFQPYGKGKQRVWVNIPAIHCISYSIQDQIFNRFPHRSEERGRTRFSKEAIASVIKDFWNELFQIRYGSHPNFTHAFIKARLQKPPSYPGSFQRPELPLL
jgi:hypothetical protein